MRGLRARAREGYGGRGIEIPEVYRKRMGKSLIIAEKPSVATDIARTLGDFKKHDDYFESEKFLISSAVGHLVEIGMPEDEEVKRGKWAFANLPAIPSKFALKPIEKTAARLRALQKLIKRKDVDQIINACDAGREGELIFRLIVEYTNAKQPVRRLWLQSMTQAAIRQGFLELKKDEQMVPLAAAARCRAESDWLVGINGTRAMTAFNSKSGGFQLTTVGRVQTPTLAILVEREERIKKFVSRNYWEVIATFSTGAGTYTGRWFDEQFKKENQERSDEHLRAERLWDESKAKALVEKCLGCKAVASEESKPSTQAPPLLFDLTSLQREANARFGFSAKTTLSIAQSLYEKHKAFTYPRTDSRALPEDYIQTVKETLSALGHLDQLGSFAKKALNSGWVKPNKRIFDNSKISDHFAIIPTQQIPKSLNELETKLYDFVVKRFVAIFFPPAEFLNTVRITRVKDEPFRSEGKILIKPGFLEVFGQHASADDESSLLALPESSKDSILTSSVDVKANHTKPPARFTEATLLSAMEGAGKLIEDEELKAAMKEKGLGTPATRSSIIEGLLAERYILREGRELVPTAKAFSIITLLRGLGIPELFSPELTAEWEYKLSQMERGALTRQDFMSGIVEMTKRIVAQAKNYESDTVPGDFIELHSPCPKCGGKVKENYKKFQCQACDFSIWKILANRQLSSDEADALFAHKQIGPLDGFRSKLGRPFTAILKLKSDFTIEFDWGQKMDSQGEDEAPDFSDQTPLGPCPKCGQPVFVHRAIYICLQAASHLKANGAEKSCDFRSGRVILHQPIEPEQMSKLLLQGKTDLMTKFISNKTKRPFSAFLVKQKDGAIGFEFEKKEPKKKKAVKVAKIEAQTYDDKKVDGDQEFLKKEENPLGSMMKPKSKPKPKLKTRRQIAAQTYDQVKKG